MHVVARGQLVGLVLSFYHMGPQNQTQVVNAGGNSIDLLFHPSSPLFLIIV